MQPINFIRTVTVLCGRCIRVRTFAHVFRYSRSHAHCRRHRRVACAVTSHPFSPFSHCNRIVSIINEPRLGFTWLSLSLSCARTHTHTHTRNVSSISSLLHTRFCVHNNTGGHAVVYPCCWLIHVWENHQRRNGRRKFPFAVTKERDTWAHIHCAYSVAQKS